MCKMGLPFNNWNITYRFNEHPCPCVWSIWTEWPTCSSTCGVGSKQRTRDVETPAINDGTDCLGEKTETAACNTDPCRKNLKITVTLCLCFVKAKMWWFFLMIFYSNWLQMEPVGWMDTMPPDLQPWREKQDEDTCHPCAVWWRGVWRRCTGVNSV